MQNQKKETHSVECALQILSSAVSKENQQERPAQNMNVSAMIKRLSSILILVNKRWFFIRGHLLIRLMIDPWYLRYETLTLQNHRYMDIIDLYIQIYINLTKKLERRREQKV